MSKIQTLNAQPLKCILTNSHKSISLLSSTGSMIVYDPDNRDYPNYHELYLADMFLASGYGAYSETERDNLHYISNAYNDILSYLHNKDKQLGEDIINSYNLLDKNKVDIQDGISSYTMTTINDDIEEYIYVKDLFKVFTNFPQYKNIEITSVSYTIHVDENDNEYHNINNSNIVEIPIGLSIKSIKIIIQGNTKNSGGVKAIDLDINDINNTDNDPTHIKISELSILGSYKKDTPFTISFTKVYDTEYPIIENTIDYTLINSFILSINGTPPNEYLSIDESIVKTFAKHAVIIKTGAIQENNLEIDPLIIRGVYPIYYSFKHVNPFDKANVELPQKMISYDPTVVVTDELKTNIININDNNIKKISILVPSQYSIVNATYTNTVKSTVINVTNYFDITYNIAYSSVQFNQYVLYIDEQYYKTVYDNTSVPFKHISIINDTGYEPYFYKGFLEFTIVGPNTAFKNKFNDDYLGTNWLSKEDIQLIYSNS